MYKIFDTGNLQKKLSSYKISYTRVRRQINYLPDSMVLSGPRVNVAVVAPDALASVSRVTVVFPDPPTVTPDPPIPLRPAAKSLKPPMMAACRRSVLGSLASRPPSSMANWGWYLETKTIPTDLLSLKQN